MAWPLTQARQAKPKKNDKQIRILWHFAQRKLTCVLYSGLEYSNLLVDEETGDVYLQTINQLLNYSPDLVLQKTLLTGENVWYSFYTVEWCWSFGNSRCSGFLMVQFSNLLKLIPWLVCLIREMNVKTAAAALYKPLPPLAYQSMLPHTHQDWLPSSL